MAALENRRTLTWIISKRPQSFWIRYRSLQMYMRTVWVQPTIFVVNWTRLIYVKQIERTFLSACIVCLNFKLLKYLNWQLNKNHRTKRSVGEFYIRDKYQQQICSKFIDRNAVIANMLNLLKFQTYTSFCTVYVFAFAYWYIVRIYWSISRLQRAMHAHAEFVHHPSHHGANNTIEPLICVDVAQVCMHVCTHAYSKYAASDRQQM